MNAWRLDHGVWRWRAPRGYYRVTFQGGRWTAAINRPMGFPVTLGVFDRLVDAKAACVELEASRRNPAGTVSREEGMRVEVR